MLNQFAIEIIPQELGTKHLVELKTNKDFLPAYLEALVKQFLDEKRQAEAYVRSIKHNLGTISSRLYERELPLKQEEAVRLLRGFSLVASTQKQEGLSHLVTPDSFPRFSEERLARGFSMYPLGISMNQISHKFKAALDMLQHQKIEDILPSLNVRVSQSFIRQYNPKTGLVLGDETEKFEITVKIEHEELCFTRKEIKEGFERFFKNVQTEETNYIVTTFGLKSSEELKKFVLGPDESAGIYLRRNPDQTTTLSLAKQLRLSGQLSMKAIVNPKLHIVVCAPFYTLPAQERERNLTAAQELAKALEQM